MCSLKDILMASCFCNLICIGLKQDFVMRHNMAGGGVIQTWCIMVAFSV